MNRSPRRMNAAFSLVLLLVIGALAASCGSDEPETTTVETVTVTEPPTATSVTTVQESTPDVKALRASLLGKWKGECTQTKAVVDVTTSQVDNSWAKSISGCDRTDYVETGLHEWDGTRWRLEASAFTSNALCPVPPELTEIYDSLDLYCHGYVYDSMYNYLLFEPEEITLNNHESLVELEWSDWGTESMSATGRFRGLNCTPDCARGTPTFEDVTVQARGLRECGSGRFPTMSGTVWIYTNIRHSGSKLPVTKGCPKLTVETKMVGDAGWNHTKKVVFTETGGYRIAQ